MKKAFKDWWESFVKKDLGLNVKAIPDHKIEKSWEAAIKYTKGRILDMKNHNIINETVYSQLIRAVENETFIPYKEDSYNLEEALEVIKFYATPNSNTIFNPDYQDENEDVWFDEKTGLSYFGKKAKDFLE